MHVYVRLRLYRLPSSRATSQEAVLQEAICVPATRLATGRPAVTLERACREALSQNQRISYVFDVNPEHYPATLDCYDKLSASMDTPSIQGPTQSQLDVIWGLAQPTHGPEWTVEERGSPKRRSHLGTLLALAVIDPMHEYAKPKIVVEVKCTGKRCPREVPNLQKDHL